jgi:GNAT superfamily N-acetyltransferase
MADGHALVGDGIPRKNPVLPGLSRDRFTIGPLTESDVEEATRLYIEVFLADEPTSRRISPDPVSLLSSARWYVRSLAGKDLSLVARDEKTHEIAGILFCFDMTDDFGSERDRFALYLSHFREAVAMIDELEDRYIDRTSVLPGTVLHVFQGAVGRRYRKNGIFRALICRMVCHARERGFIRIVCDSTNPVSRRGVEACGFSERGFSSYDTFFINGKRFFEGLEGGISLMVRDLR